MTSLSLLHATCTFRGMRGGPKSVACQKCYMATTEFSLQLSKHDGARKGSLDKLVIASRNLSSGGIYYSGNLHDISITGNAGNYFQSNCDFWDC